jgi:hypothetical protein
MIITKNVFEDLKIWSLKELEHNKELSSVFIKKNEIEVNINFKNPDNKKLSLKVEILLENSCINFILDNDIDRERYNYSFYLNDLKYYAKTISEKVKNKNFIYFWTSNDFIGTLLCFLLLHFRDNQHKEYAVYKIIEKEIENIETKTTEIQNDNIPKFQSFYMIYLEGEKNPTYKHETLEQARTEAKRLVSTYNKKAYILKTQESLKNEIVSEISIDKQ